MKNHNSAVAVTNTESVGKFPVKVFFRILRLLGQTELLKCRLLSNDINQLIVSNFIFSAVLSDQNLSRPWKSGIQLPWKTKDTRGITQPKVQVNVLRTLVVGKLTSNFSGKFYSIPTLTEIEFTRPVTKRNIRTILNQCWACSILRIHTSTFLGSNIIGNCCCSKGNKLFQEIEIDVNQLQKIFIVLDKATMTSSSPCTVPYFLKVNLHYPSDAIVFDYCEIHFIAEDTDESSLEIFKTWIIDDRIIDLYSRPDCLRKLTYFARVNEAELRTIKIKFVPDVSVPSTVKCSSIIHQPAFYPQMKKYPTGPFNGTVFTYVSTKRKQIKTYRPVHISADVLFMTFPQAAMLLVSEISPNKT
jgi:hypothetical protein